MGPETIVRAWHERSAADVLGSLSGPKGLTTAMARARLDEYGANSLTEGQRRSPLNMFLAQFRDFMILVLLTAAAISGVVGDLKDTIVIVAIVILNAVLGFVQEYRAERAMAALRALPRGATVLREDRPHA